MAGLHPDGLEKDLDRVASCQRNLLCRRVTESFMFAGPGCLVTAGFALLPQYPSSRPGTASSGVTGGAVGFKKPRFWSFLYLMAFFFFNIDLFGCAGS